MHMINAAANVSCLHSHRGNTFSSATFPYNNMKLSSLISNGVNTKTEKKTTWRSGYLNWKTRWLFWTTRQQPVKSQVARHSTWSMSSHVAYKQTLQNVSKRSLGTTVISLLDLVLFPGLIQLWSFYLKLRGKTKCHRRDNVTCVTNKLIERTR